MRIGILTFHKVVNYGAFLQAFSLSNKLKKEFPDADVEIIDYITNQKSKYYRVLRNVKHGGIKNAISDLHRIKIFNSAQKFLPLSPKHFRYDKLKDLYSYIDERYDMLIIGSDAVFNWKQTSFPTAFIPDYKFTIPVFAYAASVHGLRFYDETKDKIEKCGQIFDNFKCIGVRDKCSEDFVKFCNPNVKTMHCCDPTVFIDKEEIYNRGVGVKEKISKKYGLSLDSKYIVIMAPDSKMVEAISKKYRKDYKIVSVFVKSSFSDYYIYDLNPFEWAVVLKQSSLVVTSYFHGTLLSLVQSTPAIVLDYSGYCDNSYESKLRDLMNKRFNLPELYFDKSEAVDFNSEESFYLLADRLLCGEFEEKINVAVKNEEKAMVDFIKVLKSEN